MQKTQKKQKRKRTPYPVVGPRKIQKLGGGYYLSIPSGWFKSHRLKPERLRELLVVADRNILIVHPGDIGKITRGIEVLISKRSKTSKTKTSNKSARNSFMVGHPNVRLKS